MKRTHESFSSPTSKHFIPRLVSQFYGVFAVDGLATLLLFICSVVAFVIDDQTKKTGKKCCRVRFRDASVNGAENVSVVFVTPARHVLFYAKCARAFFFFPSLSIFFI